MANLIAGLNAQYVVLSRMRDPAVAGYLADVEGTITLYSMDDVPIEDAVDLPIVYQSGSNGVYRATIPASANLTPDTRYQVRFVSSNYDRDVTYVFWCRVG